jgi:hypothetical protein
MEPIEQFLHILDAANENSIWIPTSKTKPQNNLWNFVNTSVINQSIIDNGKETFFNLIKNTERMYSIGNYGIVVDEIILSQSLFKMINKLDFKLSIHKITKDTNNNIISIDEKLNKPDLNINININYNKAYIIIKNGDKELKHQLKFSLENISLKMHENVEIKYIFPDNKKSIEKINFFSSNNKSIDEMNKTFASLIDENDHENDKNNIAWAFAYFFKLLSYYLSWLRQVAPIDPATQQKDNKSAFQKYIKYKAKYIKLSNEINKHN